MKQLFSQGLSITYLCDLSEVHTHQCDVSLWEHLLHCKYMANMCKHKTLHTLTQHIGIYSRPFNKCQTGVYKVANSI